jgi:hypothetical protein
MVIKSRRLRWAGHVARMEEGRSALKMLTGTPAGKIPLGRPSRRWDVNITMDLKRNRYQYEELGRFGPGYGLLEGVCECGIESPCSISYGVC